MSRPLLSSRARGTAAGGALLAGVVLATAALLVEQARGPVLFDRQVLVRLDRLPEELEPLLALTVRAGHPAAVTASSLWLALLCWVMRERRACLLCVTSTTGAVLLAGLVLQPLVGRADAGQEWLFPSTHATGAWAWAGLCLVLLRRGGPLRAVLPQLPAALLLGSSWLAAAAMSLGVVLLRYHHATDVVGAAAAGGLVVLSAAAAIDLIADRVAQRDRVPLRITRADPGSSPTCPAEERTGWT